MRCEVSSASPARRAVVLALAAAVAARAQEDSAEPDEEAELAGKEDNAVRPYEPPNVEGLHWADTMDGDALSRWVSSSKEKYNGRFSVEKRKKEALIGDVGLAAPDQAKHYGISTSFRPLEGTSQVPFILQYEVRFQDGLQCGGAYVKVFDRQGKEASEFDNETPYLIMFGPDKCGSTDKVHFILKHQHPKTGSWEEKHFKDPPSVPHDQLTHLYGLVINTDNSFEVQIDGVKKASGDLLTSMNPPVTPPKEIDDPEDHKPGDWVDEAKMDDPEASKPEDWDEDEPASIPDPDATLPSGWKEDAPKEVPDPSAKMPDDWDEEEDGEWEAPIVPNPECKVGCGKWSPPTISNPKYKGKWHAPMIDNPDYKGVWVAKQIPNPDYFEAKTPGILPKIDSIGIDIWTMQGNILFDNFVIATDPARVKAFTNATFSARKNIEELQKPKSSMGNDDGFWGTARRNLIPICVTTAAILIATIWCCCSRGGSDVPQGPTEAERREIQRQTGDEAKRESEEENEERETAQGGEKPRPQAEEKAKADAAPSAEPPLPGGEKPKEEGGLGDLAGGDDDS